MKPCDFDISKLHIELPTTLKNGSKNARVSYNGKQLMMQTPELRAPFGVSSYQNEGLKFNLDLSLDGYRGDRPSVKTLYDVLVDIDSVVLNQAAAHGDKWFGKMKSKEKLAEDHHVRSARMPKPDKMDKYAPTFKMVVPLSKPKEDGSPPDKKFAVDVFDKESRKELPDLPIDETKGARIMAIFACTGVWIVGPNFGLTWQARIIRLAPSSAVRGYAFVEDGEEDEDDVDEVDDVDEAAPARRGKKALAANDDGDIDDDDDGENGRDAADGTDEDQEEAPALRKRNIASKKSSAPAKAPSKKAASPFM